MPGARPPRRPTSRVRHMRRGVGAVALALAAAAAATACTGGAAGDAQGEQVADATTTGGAWQLEYKVEESGVTEIDAVPASGGDAVRSQQNYRLTCTGSARLTREEDSEDSYAGPAKTQCQYTASGEFSMNVWREKVTGRGVPDTTALDASLVLDAENHNYMVSLPTPSFTVVRTHDGASCQAESSSRGCKWVAYTSVDSEGVTGLSPTLRNQPYPAGATTLRGETDRPDDLVAPNTTRRVSWTLTLVGAPRRKLTPTVVIEGPACACLEGEKVPGARVTWAATASPGGGTFSAIRVTSAGPTPKVVESAAGATGARVTLEPTRETGAVTLTAVYTVDGREVTATRDVSFCVMDSLTYADDVRDYAFDASAPGVLELKAMSHALYDGADASAELAWTFEPIGTASTTKLEPAHPVGRLAAVRYVGLPARADAFGPKTIEATLTKGRCACTRRGGFRAFFSPSATNHPPAARGDAPGESPSPNWYYYYAQTPAIAGVPDVRYVHARFSTRDNRQAIAQFDEHDGHIYVTDLLWKTDCRRPVAPGGKPVAPMAGGADGIDCVAQSTRHEQQHRADWAAWWPNGYVITADPDLDAVPLSVELEHPGCSSVRAASCDERPFTDVGDREINAYWVGWRWPIGSLNSVDWACGPKGKQWKDGYGCAE